MSQQQPKQKKARKRKPRANKAATVQQVGIPAATKTKSQPHQPTKSVRISGCDNLEIVSVGTTGNVFPLGSVVLNGLVTAQSTARLESLANAYQRIRWDRIRFTIEGAFPTTAGGGYVATFVRDPTDEAPTNATDAVKWAMAQMNSADAKWYDSVALNVTRSPDLLYTSQSQEGVRWYSPGVLYVVSKGGPAQVGSLTVNMEWTVTLSMPTLERDQTPAEQPLVLPTNVGVQWDGESSPLRSWLVVPTAPSASPVSTAYRLATMEDLGLSGLSTGDYIRFEQTGVLSAIWETTQDYIPIHMSGVVAVSISGVIQFMCVREVAGAFFADGDNSMSPALPTGFTFAGYHKFGGGGGPMWQSGTLFRVYPYEGKAPVIGRTDSTLLKFTPKGLRTLKGQLPPIPPVEAPDNSIATTNLSGEQ